MTEFFIDDIKRKKIVSFWIPVCLGFLHAWATALVVSVTVFGRTNSTIEGMFSSCGWGIAILVFLLISNRGLELVRVLITSKISAAGAVVEKTTTETTKVTPTSDAQTSNEVNIKANNVTVNKDEGD